MLERIPEMVGKRLDRSAYHEDFAAEFAQLTGVLWKLERGQTYQEHGDPSWEAFVAGDWERSLVLNEQERVGARAEASSLRERGVEIRRLRIVEKPVTPYVQWEMQYFRILAEEGFPLRVLEAGRVADRERFGPLPDLVLLGEHVLYHVVQESDGTPMEARHIDDPDGITAVRVAMASLFAEAEPVLEFFHREIAPLPAPTVPQ
ncbi:hypothetical protein J4H86_13635 [Spiractinospora alimapuensis]|uniref:DUF6879 family protein n=1 Tax=Spiractinospora alimapuensis TaxID=2820884 RepID=UPI001F188D55|nr:DUF6879 family protein [Spiractinospora alimapuensis]QVQ50016.1 hypothetical protein J4H86_13635 [Spiractinospora alimapuensis]